MSFDPAFYTFKLTYYKTFNIELQRWGSVFSQLIPLWILKHGGGLQKFMQAYSVSFILDVLIVFLIIVFAFGNYRAALALLLGLCIGFRDVFYYPTTELYEGLAVSFILLSFISADVSSLQRIKKLMWITASCLLVILILFYHPITIFVIVFFLLHEMAFRKNYKSFFLWFVLSFTVLWFFIRLKVIGVTGYEEGKIPSLQTFFAQFPNLFHLPGTKYFVRFFSAEFKTMIIIYALTLLMTAGRKEWKAFLILLFYPFIFIVIILITDYRGNSPVMYQSYYTIIGLFVSVSFVSCIYQRWNKQFMEIIIFLLIVINLKGIYDSHYFLTKRVQYLGRLASYGMKFEKRKFLIDAKNFPWEYGIGTWSMPFETLLYSALAHPDSSVTFYVTEDLNKFDSLINKENVFLGPEWDINCFNTRDMNHDYFHLPSTGYEKLNSSQGDTAFHESDFSNKNVLLEISDEKFYSDANKIVVVPVKIINLSGKKIPATRNDPPSVFMSYHIYDKHGKRIGIDGGVTFFDVDIMDSFVQGLIVDVPEKKGEYIIEADIQTANVRWWNINSRFTLVVN